MQDRGLATEIHAAIIDALGGANIPLSIDRLNSDKQNNVMWVLEKFGHQVPDLNRYPFLSKSYLDPQQTLKQKHSLENQKDWDQAWEWYDYYKSGIIPFLEYRIQIREKELEEMEEDLIKFNSNPKPTRVTRRLIKSYEENIPLRKTEIAKLKRGLESMKAKEMQKKQEIKPELILENENLRLKKEILEMELKLKETNRER
ncbi:MULTISPECIES: hypothetical protein [unclassified Spiroplasma]|uniref:hypothetical protein n=1 Tax=unclassified Spiroplasma TaxID=2637901 RepID=UPI0030D1C49E